MSETTLSIFVRDSLRAGASPGEIEKVLLTAGWPNDLVSKALAEFADVDFPVPVPRPTSQMSARDAFLNLVMFGMLYLAAYNLGRLFFQFVELGFPDPGMGDNASWIYQRIRFSTSALLVSFPVFLVVSSMIARQLRRDPALRTSAIRKWLTYLTLAVAACIVVGDLIYLVNSMLTGELTVRIVLKALVVGLISAAIFVYYTWTMRKDDEVLAK